MSLPHLITVFLLAYSSIPLVNSQDDVLKEYVVRKDFFTGLKASEYAIYDIKEEHVFYRIESTYNLLQNIKLIAYPSRQVVARLQAKINVFLRKAKFSILDRQSNKEVHGSIEEKLKFNSDLVFIQWSGHSITMEKDFFSLTNIFRDKDSGEILAQFRIRPASVLWTRKYDLKIFSNKYPEAIYFLAIAFRDRIASRG